MNEKVFCEKCGAEMVYHQESSTCGWLCPNCGWGYVTTYIAPINIDQTQYTLTITKIDKPSLTVIRQAANFLHVNYLIAKAKLEEGTVSITANAKYICKAALTLSEAEIPFTIFPFFPYDLVTGEVKNSNEP